MNNSRRSRFVTRSGTAWLVLVLPLMLLGCTSMRVTGDVTDALTGDVIGGCGVTIGPKYINADPAGHFAVNARKWWKKMDLVCAGYEPQTIVVDSSKTRYPKYLIRMTPRRTARHGGPAAHAAAPAARPAALPPAGGSAKITAKDAVTENVYPVQPSITEAGTDE